MQETKWYQSNPFFPLRPNKLNVVHYNKQRVGNTLFREYMFRYNVDTCKYIYEIPVDS